MRGNHLRYAENIIKAYDGAIPLAAWLKDFFRVNKQMGSSDRRTVAGLVYGYYRLGHADYATIEDRLLAGANGTGDPSKIFPWLSLLSDGIDEPAFSKSFLVQPDLFIRLRPGYEDLVSKKLDAAGMPGIACGDGCIALPNGSKVDQVLKLNQEAVIQDKSSQRTGLFLKKHLQTPPFPIKIWDSCAASGGKSIMLYDLFNGKVDLTVSDIRRSIVANMQKRFTDAAINSYRSIVMDLQNEVDDQFAGKFDLVVADAPCSGSGTWARTPEQLYFFKEKKLQHYVQLQKDITRNLAGSLRSGAYLFYVTCSIFAAENEEIAVYLEHETGLRFVAKELIRGYNEKADTMFAALLQKP